MTAFAILLHKLCWEDDCELLRSQKSPLFALAELCFVEMSLQPALLSCIAENVCHMHVWLI